jgi:ribA/ribD-fused uncharacterized protein
VEVFEFFFGGPFSQWHLCNFEISGIQYNCAEQYMMAEKARLFGDVVHEKKIMNSLNPQEQKKLGRQVEGFDNSIWKGCAYEIVMEGNIAKFSQNNDLKDTLLSTSGKTLVEANPHDQLWGIGLGMNHPKAKKRSSWKGANWLGIILTEIREELLKFQD